MEITPFQLTSQMHPLQSCLRSDREDQRGWDLTKIMASQNGDDSVSLKPEGGLERTSSGNYWRGAGGEEVEIRIFPPPESR